MQAPPWGQTPPTPSTASRAVRASSPWSLRSPSANLRRFISHCLHTCCNFLVMWEWEKNIPLKRLSNLPWMEIHLEVVLQCFSFGGVCHEATKNSFFPHIHDQEGEGEVQEASPEDEGVCVCGTHRCQVVVYSYSLGSRWDHNFASSHIKPVIPAEIGGCNFSSLVITSVIPKTSEYATKSNCILASWRYLFCLLVPGFHTSNKFNRSEYSFVKRDLGLDHT